MTPKYTFKFTPELLWSIICIAVGALASAVQAQGLVPPTDWGAWALIVVVAIVRPIGGLVIQTIFGKSSEPDAAATAIAKARKSTRQ